jgi:hypothetical protein
MKTDGSALQYSLKELTNDREIVLTAINSWQDENKYILSLDEELFNQDDKSSYLNFLKTEDRFYEFIGESLINDKDIIIALIKANGWIINKLPLKWTKDSEVINESDKSKKRYLELSNFPLDN